MSNSKKNDTGFLNPYTVVKSLGIEEGMSVADFGSGAGHWTLAIAGEVGKGGVVYAIDVRRSVLEVLEGHIKLEGSFHIKTVHADLEEEGATQLPEGSQDVVFCSNILHQIKKPANVLKEAYRVLKPKGRLVVVDWTKDASLGPKNRMAAEDVKKLAKEASFRFGEDLNTGHSHYGLTFYK
ncbi:MAG: methyltransferase domain-containing protein [Candidatus Spechtbacterales bacterium]